MAEVHGLDLLRHERFARDAAVFVPKRAIAADGNIDLTSFMAEVNDIVATRGMVLADGQVIDKPFSDRIGYCRDSRALPATA
jgi:hypothetical protein